MPAMMTARRTAPFFLIAALFTLLSPAVLTATPDYANQTGLECAKCHVDAIGGGKLTPEGEKFQEELKTKGRYRVLSTTQHIVRILVGYLHMMAGIVWFGTIMYVHILLKPAYASKGLPKGELRLGWLSMIVLLITGVLLTIARMPSLESFYTTRFGVLLSVKILLFLVMLTSALIVTIYIGPRLRKQKNSGGMPISRDMTPDQLSNFDGKEGRPVFIGYQGVIYDMTNSRLWKNGLHAAKHAAGNDLSHMLKNAPHGEDKVLPFPQIGKLLATGEKAVRPFHVRLFFFFAYMNLVLVFVITFVVSLWRWW